MHPGPDDLLEVVLERVAAAALGPLRLRRALSRLRGPSRSLACAISDAPAPGAPFRWRDGVAVLAPGRFVFVAAPPYHFRAELDVDGIVETRHVRRGERSEPGRQAVAKLRTADGFVYWAAHPKLLAEGGAVLTGAPRTAG
jgi:hypothetical protein